MGGKFSYNRMDWVLLDTFLLFIMKHIFLIWKSVNVLHGKVVKAENVGKQRPF